MINAHILPHFFRPRPLTPTGRFAKSVEKTSALEKVEPKLKDTLEKEPGSAKGPLVVEQIMMRDVVAVPPTLRLEELAQLFVERKVSGFPVVGVEGQLLGLVSQKDLVTSMVEQAQERRESFSGAMFMDFPDQFGVLPGGRVSDIMTPFVYYATPDTPIVEIIDLMQEHGIHRVVVTEHGHLRGMVTSAQLLKVLRDILA